MSTDALLFWNFILSLAVVLLGAIVIAQWGHMRHKRRSVQRYIDGMIALAQGADRANREW